MGNLSSNIRRKASGAGKGERDWATLPDELLGSVAERLPAPDHARLRAACTAWASAADNHPPNSTHFPWLMLADAHEPHCFLSLSDRRPYRFYGTCPAKGQYACVGSRDGRLVILDAATSEPRLLNPITGVEIALPSLHTLPWSKTFFDVRKVAVSSVTEGLVVALALVYSLSCCHLAFARAGDREWTPLEFLSLLSQRIEDVAYHDGKFFVAFTHGQAQFFDLTGAAPEASKLYGTCASSTPSLSPSSDRLHLVSSAGNLLRVRSTKDVLTGTTTDITVMKFDGESESGWTEIKSLGDRSVFLDAKYSTSLSSRDVADRRSNCIYFADPAPHSSRTRLEDLRVFDMEKCAIEPLRIPNCKIGDDRQLNSPIWFLPSVL